jgi:CubicO group peptidase (beta-lactamase class C family)
VTLEDALCHRTGMPDHEKIFGPGSVGVRDAVRGLRHLPATAELRQKFMCNCVMYTEVTHAVETITGQTLGNFLRYRIWDPLGMKLTFWTLQDAVAAEKEKKAPLATG